MELFTQQILQVGTEGGEVIDVSVDSVAADKIGAYQVTGDVAKRYRGTGASANITAEIVTVNGNGNSLCTNC